MDLQFDCPVCLDTFKPPVLQCRNGHLICRRCEFYCPLCPICREAMPKKKIRNLIFDQLLANRRSNFDSNNNNSNANSNPDVPCSNRSAGCIEVIKSGEVENHKLDCAFRISNLCFKLGLDCNEEFLASALNDIITHMCFDHNFDGFFGDDSDEVFDVNSNRSSELELAQSCKKLQLVPYLSQESWLRPNFIRFDHKLFFVKKIVSTNFVGFMVCIDASSITAKMYSAHFKLLSGHDVGQSIPAFEFSQAEVQLLSSNFTSALTFCKIPFPAIESLFDKSRGRNAHQNIQRWMVTVSITKKDGSNLRSSSAGQVNPNNNNSTVRSASVSSVRDERANRRPSGSSRSGQRSSSSTTPTRGGHLRSQSTSSSMNRSGVRSITPSQRGPRSRRSAISGPSRGPTDVTSGHRAASWANLTSPLVNFVSSMFGPGETPPNQRASSSHSMSAPQNRGQLEGSGFALELEQIREFQQNYETLVGSDFEEDDSEDQSEDTSDEEDSESEG